LEAATRPADVLIDEIIQSKDILFQHLNSPATGRCRDNKVGNDSFEGERFDERAALVEFGVGVPRAWAEGFACLNLASPVKGFDDARWRTLIDDGGKFLDRWGAEAAKLGWAAEDVFGVHPHAPGARYHAAGLVLLINGGEVVAIDVQSASIKVKGSGSVLIYLRKPRQGAVALWALADSGPTATD
jgi:hypothetical protein